MKRLLHFFWFNYDRRENDRDVYDTSNGEIQKWAERMLEDRFDVHSTSCATQGRVTRSPSDILIGHPTWHLDFARPVPPGRSQRDWVRDNRLLPEAHAHPNTYILTPWVPRFPLEWEHSMPWLESQLDAAKLVFGICGSIWHEQTMALDGTTAQGRAKSKLVRLNMCVNPEALTVRKRAFNPVGRRRMIHVSHLGTFKGFDLLLESTKGMAVPSIGSGSLGQLEPGVVKIRIYDNEYVIDNLGYIDNSDDARMQTLVDDHDFYLHTSSMDAQATTILEFGVRGLVPIVTPESGFESEGAIYLTRDGGRNREIIAHALQMPDEELRHRSECVREHIRTAHSWRTFYDTIAGHIERTCEA
jgi:glycosyltransferase involved in cell wall biosynthesis